MSARPQGRGPHQPTDSQNTHVCSRCSRASLDASLHTQSHDPFFQVQSELRSACPVASTCELAFDPCGLTRGSRKEVIQPQVPLRLPCYDFAPVTELAFGGSLPQAGWVTDFGRSRLPWRDGRCVQGPGTYSPWCSCSTHT